LAIVMRGTNLYASLVGHGNGIKRLRMDSQALLQAGQPPLFASPSPRTQGCVPGPDANAIRSFCRASWGHFGRPLRLFGKHRGVSQQTLSGHNQWSCAVALSLLSPPVSTQSLAASSMTQHVPVMAQEIVAWLRPQPGFRLGDGTLGGGGHTRLLAQAVGTTGLVIAVDRDPQAVEAAETALAGLPVAVAHASYVELPEIAAELDVSELQGIVLDLGLSSDQLADDSRGFSYFAAGPLDLRFDNTVGQPATALVNRLSAEQLADLIYAYGEERFSRRIARRIVERRKQQPFTCAADLANVVRRSVPNAASQGIDAATRTFQALRIAVNDELKAVADAMRILPGLLAVGGRIAVITFHSLEDRIVKQAFRDDPRLTVLTRKPLMPTDDEIRANPRARSAKLRVAERVE
jgi:16S rRNA (cytosine1402-N4)-methyltransferase